MEVQAVNSHAMIAKIESSNYRYSSDSTLLLHRLPHELFSRIVLFLPLEDRIFCMETCKAWYNHFRKFPFSLWDTLEIGEPTWKFFTRLKRYMTYSVMALSFGKHAHHVKFVFNVSCSFQGGIIHLCKAECHNIQSLGKCCYHFIKFSARYLSRR